MLKREDGLIDWRMSAREIANRVRAFQPWPGSYTSFRGSKLTIWRAREVVDSESFTAVAAGTIMSIDEAAMTIACNGSSSLRIEEVQVEGKRRISAREFVNGVRLKVGDRIR